MCLLHLGDGELRTGSKSNIQLPELCVSTVNEFIELVWPLQWHTPHHPSHQLAMAHMACSEYSGNVLLLTHVPVTDICRPAFYSVSTPRRQFPMWPAFAMTIKKSRARRCSLLGCFWTNQFLHTGSVFIISGRLLLRSRLLGAPCDCLHLLQGWRSHLSRHFTYIQLYRWQRQVKGAQHAECSEQLSVRWQVHLKLIRRRLVKISNSNY